MRTGWECPTPRLIGVLSTHYAKGRKVFSFEYNPEWINSHPFGPERQNSNAIQAAFIPKNSALLNP